MDASLTPGSPTQVTSRVEIGESRYGMVTTAVYARSRQALFKYFWNQLRAHQLTLTSEEAAIEKPNPNQPDCLYYSVSKDATGLTFRA